MRRTSLLLTGCLGFLGGIGLSATGLSWPIGYVWPLSILLLHLRRLKVALLIVALTGLLLGLWRGAWYGDKLADYGPLWRHKVSLIVAAADDGLYGYQSQISFTARNVHTLDGESLKGSLVVSGFGVNSVMQGDELEVDGQLSPGLGAEEGRISYAKLRLLERHPSLIADLRRKFTAGILSSLPEPEASFAMGILVGQRASLPASVKQDLLMVGLTHIIAVSGYNLTIILQACRKLLARYSKRLSALGSLCLMAVFLLLAGNSASIDRAAIVSLLSMATAYYGRSLTPLLLLALSASITAWARPAYVWHDASWYLSFLAFYGVMIVGPLITDRFPRRLHGSVLFSVAIESVSAEIMSLPYILHNFGQMSLVGLPANMLVTVFVPLAMLLSLIAGLSGVLLTGVSGWLAWPARWLLTYMLQMAHWLAALPRVFLQNLNFTLAEMAACYVLVGLMSYLLWRKTNSVKYSKITDEAKEQN